MEYLTKIMKKTGWSSLLSSVIFAILGIILIARPEGTINTISNILGIVFIMIGIYKTISYFKTKGKYDFFNYDMAFGIIAIVIGIVTMVYIQTIGTIFRIIIGIWIIYSAIMRLNLALKLKVMNSKAWISSLVIALIMLICGLYILFTSNAIIVTVATIILIYSILDIIESIIFLINIKEITE